MNNDRVTGLSDGRLLCAIAASSRGSVAGLLPPAMWNDYLLVIAHNVIMLRDRPAFYTARMSVFLTQMFTRFAFLLIYSSSITGQVAVLAQTPGKFDDVTLSLMTLDKDSESDTLADAYVGDRRGDVVRLTTCKFLGIPLVLADATIMTWSCATAGEKQIARAAFSKDNGLTWSQPKDLFEFPGGKAQWNGQSGFVDNRGFIHLFGLEYYGFDKKNWNNSKSHLWHARSINGGKTWEQVQKVECGYQYVGCAMNAFQTKSGRILAPISCMSTRKIGAFISLCPYSDDYGATWKLPTHEITTNTGAKDWYESGNAEPVGIQLTDGRLWIVMRSQDGFQWETFSKDDGVTWSAAQHTRFVSNQSQMTIFRMKDGRLLLLWNNCGADALLPVEWHCAERTVIAAAISDDEGKTWKGYREIARAVKPGVEICNPYVVETSNGRCSSTSVERC
jgi:BNR repeat-like domain